MVTRLELVPITRDEAMAFVAQHHRTHPKRTPGWRFGVGVALEGAVVGVAMVSNPKARLPYRVDFMLEIGVRRLAIECDGHEFHDRTKQQAAYDRARDRELLRIGIPTIRFTGSEIVHSPERCADEAFRCLLALPDTRRSHRDGWDDAVYLYERQPGVEEHW